MGADGDGVEAVGFACPGDVDAVALRGLVIVDEESGLMWSLRRGAGDGEVDGGGGLGGDFEGGGIDAEVGVVASKVEVESTACRVLEGQGEGLGITVGQREIGGQVDEARWWILATACGKSEKAGEHKKSKVGGEQTRRFRHKSPIEVP